jgi:hypothetical protein
MPIGGHSRLCDGTMKVRRLSLRVKTVWSSSGAALVTCDPNWHSQVTFQSQFLAQTHSALPTVCVCVCVCVFVDGFILDQFFGIFLSRCVRLRSSGIFGRVVTGQSARVVLLRRYGYWIAVGLISSHIECMTRFYVCELFGVHLRSVLGDQATSSIVEANQVEGTRGHCVTTGLEPHQQLDRVRWRRWPV